jgi:hypothetical protein
MIARRPTRIDCDVSSVPPDLAAVDTLARLQLEGRRLGLDLQLSHASRELQELLRFAGLSDALRVEMSGHAEQRKQRLGVEEERELDDPAV